MLPLRTELGSAAFSLCGSGKWLGFFFFNIYLFCFYFCLLHLRFHSRAFSSCSDWGHSLIAACGLLIAVASLVVKVLGGRAQ